MKTLEIFLIPLLSIFVIGFLTALSRVEKDKITDKEITYRLGFSDVIVKIYISVPFLFITIWFSYIAFDRIINDNLFYIFTLTISIISGFFSINPLIVFYQYFKIEYGREIKFNPQLRRLIIKEKNKTILIDNSDIKLVEYHNASLDKAPFDFEYLKLTLKDDSKIILTNLQTNIYNYESLLKGVKRKRNKDRFFNKIKHR